jgi:hypothetical protein
MAHRQLCDDDELDDVDITEDSELCLVCGEFGQDNEIWYRCVICPKWAHEDCSGWDSPAICVSKYKKNEPTECKICFFLISWGRSLLLLLCFSALKSL